MYPTCSGLDTLVGQGHPVVVIEHNLDVIGQADWLIDLGPGPGKHGGTILYEGHVSDYTYRATRTGSRPCCQPNRSTARPRCPHVLSSTRQSDGMPVRVAGEGG